MHVKIYSKSTALPERLHSSLRNLVENRNNVCNSS